MKIGIRLEDKSIWEKRVPFIPSDIKALMEKGIHMAVQSSPRRAFTDKEFIDEGIPVQENLNDCDIIFGIKEISKDTFEQEKIYVFFSHVIKGQPHNMPMLKSMMKKGATLIDYERIVDGNNRRLIFFGRYAGLAGMMNSLWSLGQRLDIEGIATPFNMLRQMRTYDNLKDAGNALKKAGEEIRKNGITEKIHPLIIGIAGYGNVGKGAVEIMDLLPVKEILPEDIEKTVRNPSLSKNFIYKAVFKEEHCVKAKDASTLFDLQDYYRHGKKKYENCFDKYTQHLTMMINCIYWDERYPRLLTLETCRKMWEKGKNPRLRVIGDISCDINGAVQCTVKTGDPLNPVYVYHPDSGKTTDGFKGHGPVVMALDILPAELPRESSIYFSSVLKGFVQNFVNADYKVPFEKLNIPPELKRAVILYHGKLTPDYEYLEKFL